jgi:hypothetical protein
MWILAVAKEWPRVSRDTPFYWVLGEAENVKAGDKVEYYRKYWYTGILAWAHASSIDEVAEDARRAAERVGVQIETIMHTHHVAYAFFLADRPEDLYSSIEESDIKKLQVALGISG